MRIQLKKPVDGIDGWKKEGDHQLVKQIDDKRYHVYDAVTYGLNDEYLDIFYDIIDFNDHDTDDIEYAVEDYYNSYDELEKAKGSNLRRFAALMIARKRMDWI